MNSEATRAMNGWRATNVLAALAHRLWGIPDVVSTSAHPDGVSILTRSEGAAVRVVGLVGETFLHQTKGEWTPHPFPIVEGDPVRGGYRDGTVNGTRVTISSIWKEES